jgi:hypothetical protein
MRLSKTAKLYILAVATLALGAFAVYFLLANVP